MPLANMSSRVASLARQALNKDSHIERDPGVALLSRRVLLVDMDREATAQKRGA